VMLPERRCRPSGGGGRPVCVGNGHRATRRAGDRGGGRASCVDAPGVGHRPVGQPEADVRCDVRRLPRGRCGPPTPRPGAPGSVHPVRRTQWPPGHAPFRVTDYSDAELASLATWVNAQPAAKATAQPAASATAQPAPARPAPTQPPKQLARASGPEETYVMCSGCHADGAPP